MGTAGSSMRILFSLSRVRMRLTGQAGGLRDPHSGPALAPQSLHSRHELRRGAAWRSMGTRAAIAQPGLALGAEASHPLGSALPAELSSRFCFEIVLRDNISDLGRTRWERQPGPPSYSMINDAVAREDP